MPKLISCLGLNQFDQSQNTWYNVKHFILKQLLEVYEKTFPYHTVWPSQSDIFVFWYGCGPQGTRLFCNEMWVQLHRLLGAPMAMSVRESNVCEVQTCFTAALASQAEWDHVQLCCVVPTLQFPQRWTDPDLPLSISLMQCFHAEEERWPGRCHWQRWNKLFLYRRIAPCQ